MKKKPFYIFVVSIMLIVKLSILGEDNRGLIINTKTGEKNLGEWYQKQYALIIGIDNYKNAEIPQLKNAVNDAKSIASMFKKMGYEVTELYDNNATKDNIYNEIGNIQEKSTEKDSFIFYFAGHGMGLTLETGGKIGYVIPYDAKISMAKPKQADYNRFAIKLDELKTMVYDIKSKHISLLLDSCFSGLAMKRDIPLLENTDYEYYKDVLERKAIEVLTAGDDQPVSDGTGHSPFTMAILNGLEKKSANVGGKDGIITFNQLASYVKDKVSKATNNRQTPQFDNFSDDNGEYLFYLGKPYSTLEKSVINFDISNKKISTDSIVDVLGKLEIKTKQKGKIIIDGENYCFLDIGQKIVKDLKEGEHTIKILYENSTESIQKIEIEENKTKSIVFNKEDIIEVFWPITLNSISNGINSAYKDQNKKNIIVFVARSAEEESQLIQYINKNQIEKFRDRTIPIIVRNDSEVKELKKYGIYAENELGIYIYSSKLGYIPYEFNKNNSIEKEQKTLAGYAFGIWQ